MTDKRTEIDELGEFGLIDRIKANAYSSGSDTKTGIGDDSAVITSQEENLLVSTDQLIEGVHFDLTYMPLKHLGYKAVAVNVSDIAAMNGIPTHITVSIGVSNRFSIQAIDELYAGIRAACENYKVDLIGGDTSATRSGLYISVTALGKSKVGQTSLRSGAGDKDIICVTGDLGAAFIGLQILEREKQVYLTNPEMQPKLEGFDYVVQRQLRPEARTDIIYELKELGLIPTSMIDVSDGLASDLMHICSQSQLGARIYEDKLPIDNQTYETAVQLNLDPITCVLNGGEDYELLFTIKQEDMPLIEKHADIHFIGYMHNKEKTATLYTKGENIVPLTAQGWNHFSDESD